MNSRLGLGMGTMGGFRRRIPRDEAFLILDAAYGYGIRHFDTATWYGAGWAEIVLGDWIETRKLKRSELFICTKIARSLLSPTEDQPLPLNTYPIGADKLQVFDYSAKGARMQANLCLEHLKVDYIDALLLHELDRTNHGDHYPARFDEAMAGTYQTLITLKKEGLAKSIGIGVNNYEPFDDVMNYQQQASQGTPIAFDCGVLAGRYTLLEQDALKTLNRAKERNIKIYAAGLLNSGVLATGATSHALYNYTALSNAPEEIKSQLCQLIRLCEDFNVPLGAAALQFPAAHGAVDKCILGPDTLSELDLAVCWMNYEISDRFWNKLKTSGLLNDEAPLPQLSI